MDCKNPNCEEVNSETWFDEFVDEIKDTPEFVASKLMIEITSAFGERMEQIGITQEALADRLGVKQSYISKVLNHGTNMTLNTIAKISLALDLEVKAPVFTPKPSDYKVIDSSTKVQGEYGACDKNKLMNGVPDNADPLGLAA